MIPADVCASCRFETLASRLQSFGTDLKRLVDVVRDHLGSGVVVLGSVQDGRVPFAAGVLDFTYTCSSKRMST